MYSILRFLFASTILLSSLLIVPKGAASAASEWIITNTNDSGNGSLREAAANALDGDTITFDSALQNETIILISPINLLSKTLIIDGSMLNSPVKISGGNISRIFVIDETSSLTLKSIGLINGYSNHSQYSTITNSGTLHLLDCTLLQNSSLYRGGAIYNGGILTLTKSIFTNNSSQNGGSAIYNNSNGALTITSSDFSQNSLSNGESVIDNEGTLDIASSTFTENHGQGIVNKGILKISSSIFSGNSTSYNGAALLNWNTASINRSAFLSNVAYKGGAIYNNQNASLIITSSEFTENKTEHFGGAVYNYGGTTKISNSTFYRNEDKAVFSDNFDSYTASLEVSNSTFSENKSFHEMYVTGPGGAITIAGGSLKLTNSILANSVAWSDCESLDGTTLVNVNNIIETQSDGYKCGEPLTTSDPVLGTLSDNGGFTRSMALQANSPAIDAGNDATCELIDQRGFPRPDGTHCDIGAYEVSYPLSSGFLHTCALTGEGIAKCWGWNHYGQTTPPVDELIQISSGAWHNCGIKKDGSVVCWGAGKTNTGSGVEYGQSLPPEGQFISVSAGLLNTCAVSVEGKTLCWGSDMYGAPPNETFASITVAMHNYACGLNFDKSAVCWWHIFEPSTPPADEFVLLSAGELNTCGVLSADFSVDCWGRNNYGETIHPTGAFAQVSTGAYHVCGLRRSGAIECWGAGREGGTGSKDFGQSIPPASSFVKVDSGGHHTCGIKLNGNIACWGDNTYGQTTVPLEFFTIQNSTFTSTASHDGWILESSETSGKGGTMSSSIASISLGDDQYDKQYRGILSFDTSTLPEGAVIVSATIKIKQSAISGTNPFSTHGSLICDIKLGSFGTSTLALGDFKATASMNSAGIFSSIGSGWYSTTLNNSALAYINTTGPTQCRIRFTKDDNDDRGADILKIFSGNANTASYRPVLIVEYYIP